MNNHTKAVQLLHKHMTAMMKCSQDMQRLMDENNDRQDLIPLPATPQTHGMREAEPEAQTVTEPERAQRN